MKPLPPERLGCYLSGINAVLVRRPGCRMHDNRDNGGMGFTFSGQSRLYPTVTLHTCSLPDAKLRSRETGYSTFPPHPHALLVPQPPDRPSYQPVWQFCQPRITSNATSSLIFLSCDLFPLLWRRFFEGRSHTPCTTWTETSSVLPPFPSVRLLQESAPPSSPQGLHWLTCHTSKLHVPT